MAGLLTNLGLFFTAATAYIGDIAELYATVPVLTIGIGFVFTGFVVSLVSRLVQRT